MRILYLRNTGMQCIPHVGSILQLGQEQDYAVKVFDYFTDNSDDKILKTVREFIPDIVIWLGVCGGPYETRPETFRDIRKSAKTVCLCPEASHPDWDRLIKKFYEAESFDLIVNLDGNSEWDCRKNGLTTLAIFDQRPFVTPMPWDFRFNEVGFCGGSGSPGTMRQRLIDSLKNVSREKFRFIEFPFEEKAFTYQSYANFMMCSKIIVNAAGSSGDKSKHVKGRVIETGLAGACLFEEEGSPIDQWFSKESYITFSSPEDCIEKIDRMLQDPLPLRKAALNLYHEVREKYSPSTLWNQVFSRLV